MCGLVQVAFVLCWCFFFFKQKTAYEMLRSLVGSEMCIRDRNKDDVDVVAFRQECRKFAEGWIDIQRAEFKRLGLSLIHI